MAERSSIDISMDNESRRNSVSRFATGVLASIKDDRVSSTSVASHDVTDVDQLVQEEGQDISPVDNSINDSPEDVRDVRSLQDTASRLFSAPTDEDQHHALGIARTVVIVSGLISILLLAIRFLSPSRFIDDTLMRSSFTYLAVTFFSSLFFVLIWTLISSLRWILFDQFGLSSSEKKELLLLHTIDMDLVSFCTSNESLSQLLRVDSVCVQIYRFLTALGSTMVFYLCSNSVLGAQVILSLQVIFLLTAASFFKSSYLFIACILFPGVSLRHGSSGRSVFFVSNVLTFCAYVSVLLIVSFMHEDLSSSQQEFAIILCFLPRYIALPIAKIIEPTIHSIGSHKFSIYVLAGVSVEKTIEFCLGYLCVSVFFGILLMIGTHPSVGAVLTVVSVSIVSVIADLSSVRYSSSYVQPVAAVVIIWVLLNLGVFPHR